METPRPHPPTSSRPRPVTAPLPRRASLVKPEGEPQQLSERRLFVYALTGEKPQRPRSVSILEQEVEARRAAAAASLALSPRAEVDERAAADRQRKASRMDVLCQPRAGYERKDKFGQLPQPRRTHEAIWRRDQFLIEHQYRPNPNKGSSPRRPTTRELMAKSHGKERPKMPDLRETLLHLRHSFKTGVVIGERYFNTRPSEDDLLDLLPAEEEVKPPMKLGSAMKVGRKNATIEYDVPDEDPFAKNRMSEYEAVQKWQAYPAYGSPEHSPKKKRPGGATPIDEHILTQQTPRGRRQKCWVCDRCVKRFRKRSEVRRVGDGYICVRCESLGMT